jgi:two-component system, NtrC family, sensor histidine kinase KinB
MKTDLGQDDVQKQLEIEIKRRTNQMIAVHAVTSVVGTSLDLNTTLEVALLVTMDMIGAEASGISMIDEDTGELVMRAQRGWTHDFTVRKPMRIPLGQGMSGQVIANDDVLVLNNMDGTETFAFPRFQEERFRSIALAPMHSRGEIIGILSVMSNDQGCFDQDIVNVLRVVADTVGVALDNARLYARSIENEHRLSAIINSTADGIIATDHTGLISLVNHAAEAMLGTEKSQLIGLPLREAPILAKIRDSLLLALASRVDETHRTFQVTLDDERIIDGLVSPIHNASQLDQDFEMDGWVIVLQDVTFQRQEQIARTKFIQAAAHDMRNPLSVTQSALTMLDMVLIEKDDKIMEIIGIARGGIRRLRNLIDNLSDLEKIESGYNFTLVEISLLDVLHEVGLEARLLMQDKSIIFTTDIEPDLPLVKIDPQWFKRALHNYLENARKYTQTGGEVTLRTYHKNAFNHIEVTDNGSGIGMAAQKRLFERFYRVQEHKGIEGSGLGLAIVKSVAEAHGGQVYIDSAPGKGSTFGLKLPVSA